MMGWGDFCEQWEAKQGGPFLLTLRGKTGGAISINIERQNGGWGGDRFLWTKRGQNGGVIFVKKERQNGGEISVNFIVKQPLPVPESGYHILSVNPCSLFLSSHSVTRASSWGREEEKPRVRGNMRMGEWEKPRGRGNRGIGETGTGRRGEWEQSNWGIIQTGYNRENGGMNNRGNGEWEGNENSAIGEC